MRWYSLSVGSRILGAGAVLSTSTLVTTDSAEPDLSLAVALMEVLDGKLLERMAGAPLLLCDLIY